MSKKSTKQIYNIYKCTNCDSEDCLTLQLFDAESSGMVVLCGPCQKRPEVDYYSHDRELAEEQRLLDEAIELAEIKKKEIKPDPSDYNDALSPPAFSGWCDVG